MMQVSAGPFTARTTNFTDCTSFLSGAIREIRALRGFCSSVTGQSPRIAATIIIIFALSLPRSLDSKSLSDVPVVEGSTGASEATGAPPSEVVDAEDLAHPRLLFGNDNFQVLRSQSQTSHAAIWEPILAYARDQLGTVPPVQAPSDGDLEVYRSNGNQLIPLAFACVITEEPAYCELAKSYLLTYAQWTQWGENNWRDLGHAHMLLGNALAYDWLFESLTSEERDLVRTSLGAWAEKMYEASAAKTDQADWNNWWRQSYMQNHYWINNSALGIAGLALLGDDPRAQEWIDQASGQIAKVQAILDGIGDGTWHEGIPYQNYALAMTLPFLINLRSIQGDDLFSHDYLSNYPYWRLYNLLPDSSRFAMAHGNFDWIWSNDYGPVGTLRFTASEYVNGYAEWTAEQLIATNGRAANIYSAPWHVFEFLYYDPWVSANPPTYLPKARRFSDLEGVIWRTGWEEDDLVFGFKTGAPGGRFGFDSFAQQLPPWNCEALGCQMNIGHDHDDSNGFYLALGGSWLAPETVRYNGEKTSLHNTILVDGQGQAKPAQDKWRNPQAFSDSNGRPLATADTPSFHYVSADATQRYPATLDMQTVARHVIFVRDQYLVLVDDIAAAGAHNYEWISHFGQEVSIEGDRVRGDAGDGQILAVGVAAPQPFSAAVGDDGQPYVRLQSASAQQDLRFITVLYPSR